MFFPHPHNPSYRNLNLGFTTKTRADKNARQKGGSGDTFYIPGSAGECERMNPHIPRQFPLGELESQCTLEFLGSDCRGQKLLD